MRAALGSPFSGLRVSKRRRFKSSTRVFRSWCLVSIAFVYLLKLAGVGSTKSAAENIFGDVHRNSRLVQAAREIYATYPYVQLMFLNEAYLRFVKSWICNIRLLDFDILKQTIFVVSDELTAQQLKSFEPEAIFYVYPCDNSDVSYGSFEYFSLTLKRLQLQNELIQAGINVFLIEADAVWFSPLSEYLSGMVEIDKASIISATDRSPGNPLISAGFIYFSASRAHFFKDYTRAYEKIVKKLNGQTGRLDHIHAGEQHLMTKMLRQKNENVTWLDECHFARGEWYQDEKYRTRCPHPKVIQNNYLVGNSNKVFRAKKWNHWFLNTDETCVHEIPIVNPNGDFDLTCAATAFLPLHHVPFRSSLSAFQDVHVLSVVDHTFYLVKESEACQSASISSRLASNVTCVVGVEIDRCLFTRRELMNYAEFVTAAHGYVHLYARYKQFQHIAVIEEDVSPNPYALKKLANRTNAEYIQRLVMGNDWNIIRFGRLPYFFADRSSAEICPVECMCELGSVYGDNLCQMRASGCDMRSADFYISSSRIFLKVAELVNDDTQHPHQRANNRKVGVPMNTPRLIIDTQILPRIDKQWYYLPQLSYQVSYATWVAFTVAYTTWVRMLRVGISKGWNRFVQRCVSQQRV